MMSQLLTKFFTGSILMLTLIACCSSVFGQECNIIFVTPNGASGAGAGTKTNPASLSYALSSLVNATNKKVWMSQGTYNVSNPIYLPNGIELEGGFNALTWEKSNGLTTRIFRDNLNQEPNPERLVAIYGLNISNFRLQDLTIQTSGSFSNGGSTYGLYLSGCSNYQIVRTKVIAGNAANGNQGNIGTGGLSGANGENGQGDFSNEDNDAPRFGGLGGSGSFPGSFGGGTGGDGGPRGTWEFPADGESFPGTAGSIGQGPCPGFEGNGGLSVNATFISIGCDATEVNSGYDGGDGCDGQPGTDGLPGQYTFSGGFFIPGTGTNGLSGTNGSGGGGGGGGGSQGNIAYDPIFNIIPNTNGTGCGGGGGGEGGQGASGGQGGQGGGGSFAVYLDNNGSGGMFKDCAFTSGSPGVGGLGGPGGIGGPGGLGGDGALYQMSCDVGWGGKGGSGGKGGNGGRGGKGSDGISMTMYVSDGSQTPNLMNINSLQQPFATIDNKGCTNSPITLTSTTQGTIEWYFGTGATPNYVVGETITVSFSTLGRKTFTMLVNGVAYTFTEFIDIFNDQASNAINPVINSTNSTVCAGSSGDFSSSITGTSYIWKLFKDDTLLINDFSAPPAGQSLTIPFPFSGNYLLTLSTTSACCGTSFPDSFRIQVDSILPPGIVISSSEQENGDTVCEGAFITFTAAAENAGANPSFQWRINGGNVATGSTFSSNTLSSGDVIDCVLTSSAFCSLGQTVASNQKTVTIISAPQVTCTADSLVANKPTYFNAIVNTGGVAPFSYNWDFGDNFYGFGDSVQHLYTERGVYAVNVLVTDANGCVGACSTLVNILVELAAAYKIDTVQGCAPFTVQFTNQSTNAINYLWEFGDGVISTEVNPQHTYLSSGTYDINLTAFGGAGSVNQVTTGQVAVFPSPTAQAQAYPNQVINEGDTVFFADNSFNAHSWFWNFGDGTTSNEQNPTHVYLINGCYDAYLAVTNEYGCSDTIFLPNFVCKTVGIESLEHYVEFSPNPVIDKLFLKSNMAIESYSISDLTGKIILKERIPEATKEHSINLPVSITEGVYFLKLCFVHGKNSNYKIVKRLFEQ